MIYSLKPHDLLPIPYVVFLAFSVFIVAYPMTFSAFPLIYSCFRFDLLLHFQLINGTLQIFIGEIPFFSFCIPHHLLVHFPCFIIVFPMIYHCISNYI